MTPDTPAGRNTPPGATATPTPNPPGQPSGFVATHWTLVLRARGQSPAAQAALGELCEAYYAPVQAFIRATTHDDEAARDLTQEFFARVLAGSAFDRVAPERGRFRSFLLGAVKHFLADMRARAGARKRGGGAVLVPLEPGTDTSPGLEVPDAGWPGVDAAFDRQWACALLDRSLRKLGAEMAAEGKGGQFDVLKPWLTGVAATPQSEAAMRLGLNEGAVKVAIHRLRGRFRDLVKGEIAQTVQDPAEEAAELNYLIEVVSRPPAA
jgi:RNA polymerase sigma-70 factor (ECF subfamily)